MKTLSIAAGLVVLLAGSAIWLLAAPTIGVVQATPNVIPVNTPTEVTVTAVIIDASLISTSVNLNKIGTTGASTILGQLRDDGRSGDAVARDNIFTLRQNFIEGTAGQIQLQVSAAFRGLPRRVVSAPHILSVTGGIPPALAPVTQDRITTSPDGQTIVKDEILVILNFDTHNPNDVIHQIAGNTNGIVIGSVPETLTYQIQYSGSSFSHLEQIRLTIEQMPNVEAATMSLIGRELNLSPPKDPEFSSWDENNPSGNNWGFEFIKALSAWQITTGNHDLPVAVIDANFDLLHGDLKNNITLFRGTDSKGAIGHGTHVAGIIAAEGNNEKGVTGVTWRSSLRLYDTGPDSIQGNAISATQHAMVRAIQDGARIVNISLGFVDSPSEQDAQRWAIQARKILGRAVQWGVQQNKDVLWVFAAGNGGRDARLESPANLTETFPQNTITVAAIRQDGHLRSTSNFGPAITVAAPGEDVFSTLPRSCDPLRLFCQDQYGLLSGTSQAAPFVSGLAALVLAKNPTFSATRVKSCIAYASQHFGRAIPGHTFKVITAPEAICCSIPPGSSATGATNSRYSSHTATTLNSGWVLVTGGHNSEGARSIAELYNPEAGTWRYTRASDGQQTFMNASRWQHTANLLPNGNVLIVGGLDLNTFRHHATVEMFDPSTETFTLVDPLKEARAAHRAIALEDGTVMVMGGHSPTGVTSSVEIFDSTQMRWLLAPPMPSPRSEFAATRLSDGRVFVCGGQGDGNTAAAWLFNPSSNSWQVLTNVQRGRFGHTATGLPDGRVLIAGGDGGLVSQPFEIYNPNIGIGQSTVLSAPVTIGAANNTATTLPNGDVVMTGGYTNCTIDRNIQVYRFSSSSIVDGGLMTIPRSDHAAALLLTGQVLLTGGVKSGCPTIVNTEAEIWTPIP